MLRQLCSSAQNPLNPELGLHTRKLQWAAELHEIGSHISHSDHHKHGAYILDNADAMGFSLSEMNQLSLLVLGHRGKLEKVEAVLGQENTVLQLLSLRLAVILCHARREPELDGLQLSRSPSDPALFQLDCHGGWAKRHPQTAYLLGEEQLAWDTTPWKFEVRER